MTVDDSGDGAGSIAVLSAAEKRFVDFIERFRATINAIVKSSPAAALSSGPMAILLKYPTVLDFRTKEKYFRDQLKKQAQGHRHGRLRMEVSRSDLFMDSYRRLGSGRNMRDQLLGRLEIRYAGEEGIDAGGVLRDFYYKLSHEMLNAGYALFIQSNIGSETYMPNANSHINHNHLSYFKFCGRIVGKAIYDKELLDIHFTPAFYKAILGKPLSFKDMEAVDEPVYKNLNWMLDNDVAVLDLAFCIDVDRFGEISEVELVPGGANIPVTNENKREYVDRVVQVKLVERIKKQMESFKEGFFELIPASLVNIFNAQELEMVISGLPDVDIDDLKANTLYGSGYTLGSPQITWFWRAIRTFDRTQRVKLVQFITGTGKIPVGGFAELQGMSGPTKFSIHKDRGGSNRLPQAHTCFNQLDLPEYESYDQLRKTLELAISETEGFGFA